MVWKYPALYICKLLVVTPTTPVDTLTEYLDKIGIQDTMVVINKCFEQLESQPHQGLLEKCKQMDIPFVQTDCSTGDGIEQIKNQVHSRLATFKTTKEPRFPPVIPV